MTSALIHVNGLKAALPLRADLEAAGIQVLGVASERAKLLQEVVRHAPDVVICDETTPDDALFRATLSIALTAPCPLIVFTNDLDAAYIARAIESGIHAYVVQGYGANRLRPLIHLAQARFRHEQAQRNALQDVTTRFEERGLVERAKGILMRARQVSEDEAFQVLRTVSMHTNQRLGQVAQQIIHSARFAEDVNRCGQLRMLSQRLVKLYGLQLAGVHTVKNAQQAQDSVQRIDANLAHLGKSLSHATYGDLLGQVVQTWARLKPALLAAHVSSVQASAMVLTDELAEQLLQGAERLTSQLESAGLAPPLRVLNMAGRQRMLSQRFAKYAVLGMLGDSAWTQRCDEGMVESKAAFEQALTYLNSLPLSTPDIHSALQAAGLGWLTMVECARDAGRLPGAERLTGLQSLATASEDLLEVFEQLSSHYECSMQVLAGT
jgi:AmiR/NasT family two-component response regulator